MINENNTKILCIDIQEKLVNMLKCSTEIASNAYKILKAAAILNVDTFLTEQYPKGLGSTIQSIKDIDGFSNFKPFEKTSFSALKNEDFMNEFSKSEKKNVLLFGIETHICVYQTALELLEKDYNVYIIKDCSASRSNTNHKAALEILKQKGATITTLEIVLFEFLKSSKHPNFKEIQLLIK